MPGLLSGFDWDRAIAEKYRQSDVLTRSQAASNYADAGYKNQLGAVVKPNAISEIQKAAAESFDDGAKQDDFINQTGILGDYASRMGVPFIGGQKRGLTRVPGKGSGDKVAAVLEPGEAVLNKKAAGMIGREKIAAANKQGNQARAKEDNSKVAALLKKMGML